MGPKTTENLKAAFAGESQAHMRYMIFADKAEKEGLRNIARLFSAVSFAERVHATAHHNVVFGVKPTAENLDSAVAGETYEVEKMYPEFHADAEKEGGAGRPDDHPLRLRGGEDPPEAVRPRESGGDVRKGSPDRGHPHLPRMRPYDRGGSPGQVSRVRRGEGDVPEVLTDRRVPRAGRHGGDHDRQHPQGRLFQGAGDGQDRRRGEDPVRASGRRDRPPRLHRLSPGPQGPARFRPRGRAGLPEGGEEDRARGDEECGLPGRGAGPSWRDRRDRVEAGGRGGRHHRARAVAAGGGRYGAILWVKPAEVRKAAKALGATRPESAGQEHGGTRGPPPVPPTWWCAPG